MTIPHKTAIIPYLDELDELAQKMGAVNTVVRTTEGKLKGYNTDGIGFVRSLEEAVGGYLIKTSLYYLLVLVEQLVALPLLCSNKAIVM